MTQYFASDNASPAHPRIIEYVASLSADHAIAYGDDDITAEARIVISRLFGGEFGVYFVYNGTGANVTGLRSITRPWEAVICTEMAHINEDEGGAPEAIGGFKLLPVHRDDGRLCADDVRRFFPRIGFEHTNQPAVVSLTQATEVGTVYRPEAIAEIRAAADEQDLAIHMDGARIANAAVAHLERAREQGREITPEEAMREITVGAGVDLLSFGATKNGIMFGEALVYFSERGRASVPFLRKQTTQLNSKMRYLTAQFIPYIEERLWYENARRANARARDLGHALEEIPGVTLAYPTEANGVFVEFPRSAIEPLQREFKFYTWNEERAMVRLMVSWDTDRATIDRFVARAWEECTR
jgi:threonine aldolase